MKIISNCQLCNQHALHVIETEETTLYQCLHCGYASSDKFIGAKELNPEYQKLTDEMKSWAVETDNQVWIPGIITLPEGMVHPFNDGNKLKWKYAKMIDIPEEEQKNYPLPDGSGYYTQQYDVENAELYDNFYDCLAALNEQAKRDING